MVALSRRRSALETCLWFNVPHHFGTPPPPSIIHPSLILHVSFCSFQVQHIPPSACLCLCTRGSLTHVCTSSLALRP